MSENKQGLDLVIVGSIGLDDVETPNEKRTELLGGSVSYACVASSRYVKTGMVGIVGADFPERYHELYANQGIDLQGLEQVEGKTFRWGGVYDADFINRTTEFTDLNVFETFSPKLPEAYQSAPYLLLGNISPDLQLSVLDQCKDVSFVVADTMDLWINIALDSLKQVIGRVDMLMLNDSEAELLTGHRGVRKAAEAILSMGPRYVVVKRGEHGAMLFSPEGIFIVPAYPVTDVIDPTGAGDSFAGGFLGDLAARGEVTETNLRQALLTGSVVASYNVESFSLDRLAELSSEDIAARTAELAAMMQA
jgi:sugar/nucleoside kinase (ribokinase family)